jgi:hypothetical protein
MSNFSGLDLHWENSPTVSQVFGWDANSVLQVVEEEGPAPSDDPAPVEEVQEVRIFQILKPLLSKFILTFLAWDCGGRPKRWRGGFKRGKWNLTYHLSSSQDPILISK